MRSIMTLTQVATRLVYALSCGVAAVRLGSVQNDHRGDVWFDDANFEEAAAAPAEAGK